MTNTRWASGPANMHRAHPVDPYGFTLCGIYTFGTRWRAVHSPVWAPCRRCAETS